MKDINSVFNERTCYKFLNKNVEESLLKEIYDLMKFGPTSFNSSPLRMVFVRSSESKDKLYKCLMPVNVDKSKSAPVSVIFAYDKNFYEKFDKLMPHKKDVKGMFESSSALSLDTATRNSSLQAAYFMILARAKGLDCGPMSGFNSDLVNKEFFAGTSLEVNFICNLGYRDGENPYPRLPRLDFEETCKTI